MLCIVLEDWACHGKVSLWCMEKPIWAAQAGCEGGSTKTSVGNVQRWLWQLHHQLVRSLQLPTTVRKAVINRSFLSVCPFLSTLSFEPTDLWLFCMCLGHEWSSIGSKVDWLTAVCLVFNLSRLFLHFIATFPFSAMALCRLGDKKSNQSVKNSAAV